MRSNDFTESKRTNKITTEAEETNGKGAIVEGKASSQPLKPRCIVQLSSVLTG
jgi:hypothetical protein